MEAGSTARILGDTYAVSVLSRDVFYFQFYTFAPGLGIWKVDRLHVDVKEECRFFSWKVRLTRLLLPRDYSMTCTDRDYIRYCLQIMICSNMN